MKKYFIFLIIIIFSFTFSSCSPNPGKADNAVVSLGESEKFSEVEIKAASDTILKKFKDFEGSTLKKLWYDEEKSNDAVTSYMSGGRDSVNRVKEEDVIIFFSDFYVDATGGDGSFNPDFDYTDWMWIVIRDDKNGKWRVDDWGY